MKFRSAAILFTATLLLAACAGRAPDPVMVAQVRDSSMSCDELVAEIAQNNNKMSQLSQEENMKRGQNVTAGIAGAIFLVPLLAMDFQDAAGQEKKALEHRNQHLAALHGQNCSSPIVAEALQ